MRTRPSIFFGLGLTLSTANLQIEQPKKKIVGIGHQLDALADQLGKIPLGVSPAPIFNQMQKLEKQ